jgi:hypothetical protein
LEHVIFFVGTEWKDNNEGKLAFYIMMTVLVGAFCIAAVALSPPHDDDETGLLSMDQSQIS